MAGIPQPPFRKKPLDPGNRFRFSSVRLLQLVPRAAHNHAELIFRSCRAAPQPAASSRISGPDWAAYLISRSPASHGHWLTRALSSHGDLFLQSLRNEADQPNRVSFALIGEIDNQRGHKLDHQRGWNGRRNPAGRGRAQRWNIASARSQDRTPDFQEGGELAPRRPRSVQAGARPVSEPPAA
jgi:hypothetical protein